MSLPEYPKRRIEHQRQWLHLNISRNMKQATLTTHAEWLHLLQELRVAQVQRKANKSIYVARYRVLRAFPGQGTDTGIRVTLIPIILNHVPKI